MSKNKEIEDKELVSKKISDVSIENVVATATLDQKMNLLSIMKTFRITDYRPKKFPGLVFRLKRPKTATLIFGTGKMVCTGARSEKEARSAVRKVVRLLKENGVIIINKLKIEIVNIVASGDLGERIDLEKAVRTMENAMYEPEQFPGLIYRMSDPNVVLLLFHSGKLVCTGARREKDISKALEKIYQKFKEKNCLYLSAR